LENKNIDLNKLIEIFNKDGKGAAKNFVEDTCGGSYTVVQRRIKKETNYFFNRSTRKYEIKGKEESNFMTMEELYEGRTQPVLPMDNFTDKIDKSNPISDSFKELMLNLMKDKMQEINKYIYLEQSTKQIIINIEKLEQNGYKVVMN